jgi:ABC-type lipoprotein release transport system permease subunit
MRTVLYLLRTRRAWLRSWLSLALLLAVVGGGVLAVGAGARRTDTAYPRFLARANTLDILASGNNIEPIGHPDDFLLRIARLPQVAQSVLAYYLVVSADVPGHQGPLTINDFQPLGSPEPQLGHSIERFKVLDGRLPDPHRAGEVAVSFSFADNLHVRVGDRLTIRPLNVAAFTVGQPPANGIIDRDRQPLLAGAARTVQVSAVVATPIAQDFPPLSPGQNGSIYFTPAFLQQNAAHLGAFSSVGLRLRHGAADVPDFVRAAEQVASDQQVQFQTPQEHQAVVQSSVHVQATGLGVLAALATVVLLLVLGQGVARRIALDAVDHDALRTLGATRPQLFSAAMVRAATTGIAGAALAALVAFLLSPLSPVGVARDAEPKPGFDLDVAVVLGGAAALALLVVLLAALPAWRAAGAHADSDAEPRATRVAEWLSRASFPVSAVAGVRLALDRGRGRAAVPVRSAITACTVGALTVAAALSFSASFDHLLNTPALYGWNWDAVVGNTVFADHAARTIAANSWVAADAAGTGGEVGIDGDRAVAFGVDSVKGSIDPVLASGRAPRAGDEIMLGTQTDTRASIGQTVRVHVGNNSLAMRVVGRGILPVVSDTARLGVGAWMRFGTLQRLLGQDGAQYDTLFVRFAGDNAAGRRHLAALLGYSGTSYPQTGGLGGVEGISALPVVLGAVLAAGAIATLAHAVLTSVQRRRRDLAILRTLGFVRGQVAMAVAWQTTTIAAIAAVIGAPLGAAAGRWAWMLFAGQQGFITDSVVPVGSLLLMLAAALLVANLVAAIPGRFAARTSPAIVLRAE